jgi:lipopolysaccharide exporter
MRFSALRQKLTALVGGGFLRHVAVLMSGTLLAQLITFAAMPVLSRLFLPVAFGVLGMLNSMVNILSGISSLRYDMSIILPEKDDDAANLLVLSMGIVLGFSLLLLIPIALGGQTIAAWVASPQFAGWLWLVPGLVFLTGSYQALTYWCSRQKKFKRLSLSAVTASASSAAAKLIAGFAAMGTGGLVGGQVLGQLLASGALTYQVLRDDLRLIRAAFDVETIKALALKHADFPRYNAPVTLINGLTNGMPVLLFGVFFGPAVAGYYSLAYLILKMPVQLVSNSLRQVYLQRASQMHHRGEALFHDQRRMTALLFLAGLVPAIIAMGLAPVGFEIVLGAPWVEAGQYARYLMPFLFVTLIGVPSTALVPILNLQRWLLLWQIVTLSASAAAIAVGGYLDSPLIGVMGFSAVKTVMIVLLIASVLIYNRRNAVEPSQTLQK